MSVHLYVILKKVKKGKKKINETAARNYFFYPDRVLCKVTIFGNKFQTKSQLVTNVTL